MSDEWPEWLEAYQALPVDEHEDDDLGFYRNLGIGSADLACAVTSWRVTPTFPRPPGGIVD